MPERPYIEARAVNLDKPPGIRRYIVFYAWDARKEELVRKRDYDVDKLPTRTAQKEFAKRRIREINKLLANGYHINPKKHQERKVVLTPMRTDYTIAQAFRVILPVVRSTKRKDTYDSYSSVAGLFLKFCELQGWSKWKVKTLERQDILAYLDYSQANRTMNNLTRNKYLAFLKALFSMMIARKMMTANPAVGIGKEPEEEGRNIAYQDDQVTALKELISEQRPRLWLFVQFLFYGLMRPKEIGRLRVSMFELENEQIVMPASISKNRKKRYVRISAPFRKVIDQLQLQLYRPNDYVFGYNLVTGPAPIQKNAATSQHLKFVRQLGYGPDYTLYSWKHTGVVRHYKAGVDIKSIQQQIGHSSLEETNRYLKSLGLLADKAAFDKGPEI